MKLLFDEELRESILSLISNADERIILVSPFIILEESKEYLSILEEKSKNNVLIELHTRSDKSEKISEYFKEIKITIFPQENLHAKLYINESIAIVTSLNLIDYSIKNNIEIGFKTENETEYDNIVKEFYLPKLINNNDKNIFQHRINTISKIINDKGKYFSVNYKEPEKELIIEHEKYIIKYYGNEICNYKILVNEVNDYDMLKSLEKQLRKYIYARVYNNDNDFSFDIFFESSNIIDDTYDTIVNDTYYDIIDKLYYLKSTIAYLLYRKK